MSLNPLFNSRPGDPRIFAVPFSRKHARAVEARRVVSDTVFAARVRRLDVGGFRRDSQPLPVPCTRRVYLRNRGAVLGDELEASRICRGGIAMIHRRRKPVATFGF